MTKLRILHFEDSDDDAALVGSLLEREGLAVSVSRVGTREAFVEALESHRFDLVLSDYSLPGFDGLAALREASARQPQAAFIFFSGTIGEDRAVEALKAGATDLVLKDGRGRLVPAIQRALRETEDRAARLRAERALRQSEESFRLLFASNPHPMWVFDRENLRFLEVNEAAVAHYGYSREEFLGMRVTDIQSEEDAPAFEAPLLANEVKAAGPAMHGTWRHRLKGGRLITVEVFAHELDFGGRPGRLVVVHDVTEQKSLEAQLLQSQKMDAVGRLAGGMAHDFNNLLGVIVGLGGLLVRELPEDGPARDRVGRILAAAERGSDLTRQLLAFSRKQVLQPRTFSLNATVTEVESMLRRMIGEDVELVTSLDAHLGLVKADPGQMIHVILNLAVNARDAMPRGGRLTIETSNVELGEAYVRAHPYARPGAHVLLSVADNGQGMSQQTLAHLFEPFFTTKDVGKGTGLGLATVYGIVKQSGGHVTVNSEVGHGSTLRIYLPRVDQPAAAEATASGPAAEPARGSETVLLVEDEDSLRAILQEILESGGYRVVPTASAEEAIARGLELGGQVDLLVTDIVMPRMSGPEVAARLAGATPSLKVLYISGYAADVVDRHEVEPGRHFLQKPFALPTLLTKVRAVLDE
jgi:two-component system, cell cycle sensor histidine kinase and response regulator CckA